MKKILIIFLILAASVASAQYSPMYDTVRLYRGGKLYYQRSSGDTVFINADTLLKGAVGLWQHTTELEGDYLTPLTESDSVLITGELKYRGCYVTPSRLKYVLLWDHADSVVKAQNGLKLETINVDTLYINSIISTTLIDSVMVLVVNYNDSTVDYLSSTVFRDTSYVSYGGKKTDAVSGWVGSGETIYVDTSFTRIYGAGINVVTGSYPNYTITGTEVDGSTTNELQDLSYSNRVIQITDGTDALLPRFSQTDTASGMVKGNAALGSTYYLNATNEWSVPPDNNTTYSAGYRMALNGTSFGNTNYHNTIDSVKNNLPAGGSDSLITKSNTGLLGKIAQSKFQAALTNPITGTGVNGYLSHFTGSTTIDSANIYWDGNKIGIKTNTPNGRFDVYDRLAGAYYQHILLGTSVGVAMNHYYGNLALNAITNALEISSVGYNGSLVYSPVSLNPNSGNVNISNASGTTTIKGIIKASNITNDAAADSIVTYGNGDGRFYRTAKTDLLSGYLIGTASNVTAGSNKITLGGTPTGAALQAFSVDVDETKINHDNLLNYVAAKHYYQKHIDTVSDGLTGILKATSGVLSAITDNSGTWNTALQWSDTTGNLATDYDLDTLTFLRTESDPVYAVDSANTIWWADTLVKIATKYDLDTLTFLRTALQWSDTSNQLATDYDIDTLTFLRSYTETDPIWVSDSADYISKWDTNDKVASRYWSNENFLVRSGTGTATVPDSLMAFNWTTRAWEMRKIPAAGAETDPVWISDSTDYLHHSDTNTVVASRKWVIDQGYLTDALQWADTSNELATDYDLDTLSFLRTALQWADTSNQLATDYDVDTLTKSVYDTFEVKLSNIVYSSATSADSLAYFNRTTGKLEMRVMPSGTGEQLYADTTRNVGYDATYFYVDSLFGTLPGGHDPVTIGTPANGLSLSTQELSLGLASTSDTGALSSYDWDAFTAKLDWSDTTGLLATDYDVDTLSLSLYDSLENIYTDAQVDALLLTKVNVADSNKTSAGNYVTTKLLRDSLLRVHDTIDNYVPKYLVDAEGDLIIGDDNNVVKRLAMGTANQVLKVNSGGTALEWGAGGSGASLDSLSWYYNAGRNSIYQRYADARVSVGAATTTANTNRRLQVYGSAGVADSIWLGDDIYFTHWDGSEMTETNRGIRVLREESPTHLGVFTADVAGWGDSTVVIGGNGNVSIGTGDVEAARLHIASFAGSANMLNITNDDNATKDSSFIVNSAAHLFAPGITQAANEDSIIGWKASTGEFIAIPRGTVTGAPVDSLAWIKGTNDVYLRDVTDKVGIRTNTPINALSVEGGANIYTDQDTLKFWTDNRTGDFDGDSGITVLPSGYVGIGQGLPTSPLYVNGTARTMAVITSSNATDAIIGLYNTATYGQNWQLRSNGTSSEGNGNFVIYNGSASNSNLSITPSGNVGIGINAPGSKIQGVGSVQMSDSVYAKSGATFCGFKYNGSALFTSSSITQKENIDTIPEPINFFDKFLSVKPRKYNFKVSALRNYPQLSQVPTTYDSAGITVPYTLNQRLAIWDSLNVVDSLQAVVKSQQRSQGFLAEEFNETFFGSPSTYMNFEDVNTILWKATTKLIKRQDKIRDDVKALQDLQQIKTVTAQVIISKDTLTISDTSGIPRTALASTIYFDSPESVTFAAGVKQVANGQYDGQEITIIGTSNNKTLTLHTGDNLRLKDGLSITLTKFDNIKLKWYERLNNWGEVSRSQNQ